MAQHGALLHRSVDMNTVRATGHAYTCAYRCGTFASHRARLCAMTAWQVYCDGLSDFASYRCPSLGKCAFWNTSGNAWDSNGCMTLAEVGGALTCTCSHLTSFAVVQDTVQYVNALLLSAGELKKEVRPHMHALMRNLEQMWQTGRNRKRAAFCSISSIKTVSLSQFSWSTRPHGS